MEFITILRSAFCSCLYCALAALIVPSSVGMDWASNWKVAQSSSVGAGYDSDLYGADIMEVEDGFARLDHSFELARKNSLTELQLNAHATGVRYFSERSADFLDGGLTVALAYPQTTQDVSYWRGSAYWERATDLDLSLSQRMQPTLYGGRLQGEWYASPKLGLTGSFEHRVSDRSADGATRSRKERFRAGLSHEWFPEQRWNYEYAFTRGKTDTGGQSDVHEAGVRVRGRFFPKITGEAFAGVQRANYTGKQNFSDSGPSSSVDLTWRSSPRLAAKLEVDREYDFASSGVATLGTLVTLSVERDLGRGYQFSGYLTRGFVSYDFAEEDRDDRYWMIRGEVRYDFTQRFFAQVSCAYLKNDSSFGSYDLSRTIVLLQSGMRY